MARRRVDNTIRVLRAYAEGQPSTYEVCKITGINSRSQIYAAISVLLNQGLLHAAKSRGWNKYAITEEGMRTLAAHPVAESTK